MEGEWQINSLLDCEVEENQDGSKVLASSWVENIGEGAGFRGRIKSLGLDMLTLRCLWDIQVESLSRQLT